MKYDIQCTVCKTITNDYHNYCTNCGDCKINNSLRWKIKYQW
jgi:RNA polymerase subunit RPABC4/transcription elongation factor Spt4